MALILHTVPLLWTEYTIGFELIRLLLLFTIFYSSAIGVRQASFRALRSWILYGILLVLYVGWRVFLVKPAPGASIDHFRVLDVILSAPLHFFKQQLLLQFQDVLFAVATSWSKAFGFHVFTYADDSVLPFLGYWLIGTVAATVSYVALLLVRNSSCSSEDLPRQTLVAVVSTGIAVTASGFLPVWAGMLHVGDPHMDVFRDRLLLPAMPGAVLATSAFLGLAAGRHRVNAVVSVLIGLSAAAQFQNGRTFAEDHEEQCTFFWQLSWRAPALASETTFVLGDHGEDYWPSRHYEVSAPLSLVYPRKSDPTRWVVAGYLAADFRIVPDSTEAMRVHQYLLGQTFNDTTTGFVPLALREDGSFRVLDSGTFLRTPDNLRRFLPTAETGSLVSAGDIPAKRSTLEYYFGPEPPHEWDYHYQKADLARSHSDWHTVVAHMDSVRAEAFGPPSVLEWLVFLEGCIEVGRPDDARWLIERVVERNDAPDAIRADHYLHRIRGTRSLEPQQIQLIDSLSAMLREVRRGVVSPNPGWGHRIIELDTAAVR